jgi:hypothetical protein
MQVKAKTVPKAKYDSITSAIAWWIGNNVKDDGLERLIRTASESSSYRLPSRSTLDSRLDDLYKVERNKIKMLLDYASHVALTADYWTSIANDSYLGVAAHVLDPMWILHSFALQVCLIQERHSTAFQRRSQGVGCVWQSGNFQYG